MLKKIALEYSDIPIVKILADDVEKIHQLHINKCFGEINVIKNAVYGDFLQEKEINNLNRQAQEFIQNKPDCLEEESVTKEERNGQNVVDSLKILDKIANAVDKFTLDTISDDIVVNDKVSLIVKLLETIRNYAVDDNTALQIHNIGITENLLNIIIVSSRFSDDFVGNIALTLAHLAKFSGALKKIENEIDFISPIIQFNSYILQENNNILLRIKKYSKVNFF